MTMKNIFKKENRKDYMQFLIDALSNDTQIIHNDNVNLEDLDINSLQKKLTYKVLFNKIK